MVGETAALRSAILFLLVTATFPKADAQDLGRDALDAQKRTLEAERQERLREKSLEEPHGDLAKPVERKRDPRACEAARVEYQGYCGSHTAPRYRSHKCRDAEISMLMSC